MTKHLNLGEIAEIIGNDQNNRFTEGDVREIVSLVFAQVSNSLSKHGKCTLFPFASFKLDTLEPESGFVFGREYAVGERHQFSANAGAFMRDQIEAATGKAVV